MSIEEIKQQIYKLRWSVYAGILTFALFVYWLIQIWLGPKVTGFSVVKGDLIQTVVASGRVQSPVRVEIASKITGKVISIPVSEGQSVRAGQTLIVLENSDVRAIAAQAKAAVNQAAARLRQIRELTQPLSEHTLVQAQATLDVAKKQYGRTRELSEKGYVNQAQLDDSLRNLAIAQNKLVTAKYQARFLKEKGSDYMRAESALRQAQANERGALAKLGNSLIKAESDGILISKNIEQGNVVAPGKTLMVMSPAGKTQLIVQIDEKNMRYLILGQHARVVADAYPGQRFDAELSYINPAADATRGTVEIKLDVPALPDYLRQDMTVSVDIEVARRADALTLSVAAVRDDSGNEPWVMLNNNGQAQRRVVKLGVRGDSMVEILGGLREGDQILPATGLSVKEGKRIRVIGS